jgi:hypothetical protein
MLETENIGLQATLILAMLSLLDCAKMRGRQLAVL